jgi:hypothetical protein
MRHSRLLGALFVTVASSFAGTVHVPGNTLSIPATSASGGSFVFSGTLSPSDTIDLTLAGTGCLQTAAYCTNGAGVVVVAGSTGVGGTSTFTGAVGGFSHTYNFGAIVMVISGVGAVQLLPANAANGLASLSPPSSVNLATTTLNALGFGNFSPVVNPTISFILADTNFGDNSGTLTLTQSQTTSVPAVSPWGLLGLALSLLLLGSGLTIRPWGRWTSVR